ncbi:MAG: STAS domain-containing protein [Oceanicoccus sp.]
MTAVDCCIHEFSHDHGDSVVFTLSLEETFDYRAIGQFRGLSTDKMDNNVLVLLDMTRTRFVDKTGISLLHCLQHWIRAPLVVVQLLNCHPQIRQSLSESQLHPSIILR